MFREADGNKTMTRNRGKINLELGQRYPINKTWQAVSTIKVTYAVRVKSVPKKISVSFLTFNNSTELVKRNNISEIVKFTWFPGQLRRSCMYHSETWLIKSQTKVWFTVQLTFWWRWLVENEVEWTRMVGIKIAKFPAECKACKAIFWRTPELNVLEDLKFDVHGTQLRGSSVRIFVDSRKSRSNGFCLLSC